MEFLKNCTTGVQLIDGFSFVNVKKYSIFATSGNSSQDEDSNAARTKVVDQTILLEEAAASLRASHKLAAVHIQRSEIWHFSPSDSQLIDVDDDASLDLFSNHLTHHHPSYQLQCVQNAVLRAANVLVSRPNTTANSNSTNTKTEPNEENHQIDADIRPLFIVACHQLFQYRAVKESSFLPINGSKLLYTKHQVGGALADLSNNGYTSRVVTEVDIQLLASGRLLVSLCPTTEVVSLGSDNIRPQRGTEDKPMRTPVLLAPYGHVAFLDVIPSGEEEFHAEAENLCSNKLGRAMWRDLVRRGLIARGINCEEFADDAAWTPIFFPRDVHSLHGDISGTLAEWPANLCYVNGLGSRTIDGIDGDTATKLDLESLSTTQNNSTLEPEDPIDFAMSWRLQESDRDSRVQDEKRQKGPSPSENEPVSPPLPRSASNMDSAALTVYPTPPDGAQTQETPGSQLADDGTMLSEQSPQNYSYQPNADDYENDGITDADFSFFDEPDDPVEEDIEADSTLKERPSIVTEDTPPSKALELEKNVQQNAPEANSPNVKDHASSSKIEDLAKNSAETLRSRAEAPIFKMPSTPPLSPAVIKNSLELVSLVSDDTSTLQIPQNLLTLNKISFNQALRISDNKYSLKGRFSSNSNFRREKRFRNGERSHWLSGSKHIAAPARQSRRSTVMGLVTGKTQKQIYSSSSDSEASSYEMNSDYSDVSDSTERWKRSTVSRNKRLKRNHTTSVIVAAGAASNGSEVSEDDNIDHQSFKRASNFLFSTTLCSVGSFRSHAARSNRKEEASTGSHSRGYEAHENKTFIAQNVAQQIAHNTTWSLKFKNSDDEILALSTICNIVLPELRQVTVCFGTEVEPLDFFGLTIVQDLGNAQTAVKKEDESNKTSPSSTNSEDDDDQQSPKELTFSIVPRNVCLSKQGASWRGYSSAIPFWETLGLGPSGPPRNISGVCIYPGGREVANAVEEFLSSFKCAYESCALGTFGLFAEKEGMQPGLLPVETGQDTSSDATLTAWKDACVKFVEQMPHISDDCETLLLLMVNPFKQPDALYSFSSCFWSMLQESKNRKVNPSVGFTMQIVPLDVLTSPEMPMLLRSGFAAGLAKEVYEKCGSLFDQDGSVDIRNSPLVTLEAPMPKSVDFESVEDPPFNLLHETSVIHVAYAQSSDKKWLAAAWTDNEGKMQTVAPFYTGHRLDRFLAAADEIWKRTMAFAEFRNTSWRVFIVKCGALHSTERSIWQRVAKQSTNNVTAELYLLACDTSPTLLVVPNTQATSDTDALEQSSSAIGVSQVVGAYTTPVSTPQAFANSPSQTPSSSMPPAAATPTPSQVPAESVETDTDSILLDKCEESWGVILGYRRNVSCAPIRHNPALASGYLVKRSGPGDLDPPLVFEVDLMGYPGETTYSESREDQQARYNATLKETLKEYSGLGLLARLKGIADAKHVAPWHVLVASRIADALGKCMAV